MKTFHTLATILKLVDDISGKLSSKNHSIDLCKAFDRIDRNLLLQKLRHYGV